MLLDHGPRMAVDANSVRLSTSCLIFVGIELNLTLSTRKYEIDILQ